MTQTKTQRSKNPQTKEQANAGNKRKRANQVLAGKLPRRTRHQRRKSVMRFKNKGNSA